jgi:predicted alpha/beta superfamily hydrolase
MLAQSVPATIPSAEFWTLHNASGEEYLIQVGFPRGGLPVSSKSAGEVKVPIWCVLQLNAHFVLLLIPDGNSYVTDGNSVFLSALEAMHRRIAMGFFPSGLIVAIGYPISEDSDKLFDSRRSRDLTPPSKGCKPEEGGANDFLGFITQNVRPFIYKRLNSVYGAIPGKEALYGHSYGGLFALHALFQKPGLFDFFIASSPSIWWNNKSILEEEEEFRRRVSGSQLPESCLMLFVGGDEQDPRRKRWESGEEYNDRQSRHLERGMVTNAIEMYNRLKACRGLHRLSFHEYSGEDHGTVIACSLSQGLTTFFEDWPYDV